MEGHVTDYEMEHLHIFLDGKLFWTSARELAPNYEVIPEHFQVTTKLTPTAEIWRIRH